MIADDSCSVFMSIYTKTEFRRILRLFLIYLLFHCPKYSIFRDRFYRKLEYHLVMQIKLLLLLLLRCLFLLKKSFDSNEMVSLMKGTK